MKQLLKSQYSRLFLGGLVFFIVAAIFSEGYHHPDEHFQILEFCSYILGKSPAKDMPWEFSARMRPSLQPYIAYLVVKIMGICGIESPFTVAFALRLLTGLFTWFIMCKLCLALMDDFKTERGKRLFVIITLFLWCVPYLCVRFSAENMGGTVLLYAIYLLLKYSKEPMPHPRFTWFVIGLLLGFSFFLRFQIAFAFLGLAAWMIFIAKLKPKALLIMLSGAIIFIGFSVWLDYIFYGTFVFTPYNYFHSNIIGGSLSDAGVSPWWWYFRLFILQGGPPISIVLLLSFFVGIYTKPTSIFSLCIIPYLLVHFMIGHKETRFLFPMLFEFLYLSAIGCDSFIDKYKPGKTLKYSMYVLIFINLPLMAYRTLVPANEAIDCYRFIYNFSRNRDVTLVCKERSAYHLDGQEVHFYRPPNVHVVVFKTDSGIVSYLHKKSNDKNLLFVEGIVPDSAFNQFPKKRIYSLFPEWLLKFNINNWQERSRIWCIYEIKPKDH